MLKKGGTAMPKTLLIVDDEPDVLAMLQDYFEIGNYQVLTAPDGPSAIRLATQQPDLILLDVNMPGLDGFEVCKHIRPFVSCPILFLTAKVEDEDKIKGFLLGGDDYIVKPFSVEELGARVAAHIRRDQRQKAKPVLRMIWLLTIRQRKCILRTSLFPLPKRSLKSSSFFPSTVVRFLIKNASMKSSGVGIARAMRQSLPSIFAASARN